MKGSDLGYDLAQFNAGRAYLNGWGVAPDEARGLQLMLRSANQGYAPAQFTVGWCYQYGRGTGGIVDVWSARQWYQKAADQGKGDARVALDNLNRDSKDAKDGKK